MCSISGIIQIHSREQESEQLKSAVERMNEALHHRGPDDQGVVCPDTPNPNINLCLGNTRLSIIDTSSAGHQPMHDPETGNWITYNGEAYNFRQLRSELGNEFGPWRSNSDTEVILKAYRKWGTQAFLRLRGMFAIAIWDSKKRQLILARDSFGIKPLYCYFPAGDVSLTAIGAVQDVASNTMIFASEVRALMASGLVPGRLSSRAVTSFLEYGSVQAPLTIIENVWSVMPGTCVTVRESVSGRLSLEVSDFRSTTLQLRKSEPSSRSEAKLELRRLLEDSVKGQLVSDVPLGVFLSGGMDSSALVALISKVTADRPRTFSVVFDEDKFNEAHYSQTIASKFNTNHHEIKLTEQRLLNILPNALQALDQPSMDGVNTFVVSGAVKEAGVTVALSGLGGDELFGGYPSFRRALRLASTNQFSKTALRSLGHAGRVLAKGTTQRDKLRQLALQNDPHDVYRISRQLFSPDSVNQISSQPFSGNGLIGHHSSDQPGTDTVNLISRFELDGYMANTLLRDTDAMSMAHSLEVRVPLLDNEVASYVLSLPGQWKLGPKLKNVSKPLLAETIADLLPDHFLSRRKMGFTLPFERWLALQLRDQVTSVFADQQSLAKVGINQKPVNEMWNRFLRQPRSVGWSRPWAIFVLARWCESNNVSAAAN
jgi:asparagine synthase (glutamine-hydrolysing)